MRKRGFLKRGRGKREERDRRRKSCSENRLICPSFILSLPPSVGQSVHPQGRPNGPRRKTFFLPPAACCRGLLINRPPQIACHITCRSRPGTRTRSAAAAARKQLPPREDEGSVRLRRIRSVVTNVLRTATYFQLLICEKCRKANSQLSIKSDAQCS